MAVVNRKTKIEPILEEMLRAGVHFGYSSALRNPKMDFFISSDRNTTEIFDLEKTKSKLDSAKEFLKNLGKEKKTILFAATKKDAQESVERIAKELSMPYVTERWLGGVLTNFKEIKGRIDFLNDLLQKRASGELDKYTKKERLQMERKISHLEKYLSGLKEFKNLPSALIAVDSNEEIIAVKEARKIKIPVIAIMNNDCDPDSADYPIPANDSSVASIDFLLKELAKAYQEGAL